MVKLVFKALKGSQDVLQGTKRGYFIFAYIQANIKDLQKLIEGLEIQVQHFEDENLVVLVMFKKGARREKDGGRLRGVVERFRTVFSGDKERRGEL